MKLNGLKEEHYFNEIASKGTKMRIEVISHGMKKKRFIYVSTAQRAET